MGTRGSGGPDYQIHPPRKEAYCRIFDLKQCPLPLIPRLPNTPKAMAPITILLVCLAGSTHTVIVALRDGSKSMVEQAATSPKIAGHVISQEELRLRLGGNETLRTLDRSSLEKMLDDARDLEARFDATGAAALRTAMITAFDTCPRPSPDVTALVATAMQDAAAALLSEGQTNKALDAAKATLQRFPDTMVDSSRHPPDVVDLFDHAKHNLASGPHANVSLVAKIPGTFVIEGARPTIVTAAIVVALPIGRYRVWWVGESGTSLPHWFNVTTERAAIEIEPSWETKTELVPVVSLACTDTCADDLRSLGQRVGANRAIGVGGGDSYDVDVATGETHPWQQPLSADQQAALEMAVRPQFSPWYLVPVGVGQFAQDRPFFGGGYAAAQAGLLAWHLYTWQRHATAVDENDHAAEPNLRSQRNLSAILFYSSIAASVVEALIVGWATGK